VATEDTARNGLSRQTAGELPRWQRSIAGALTVAALGFGSYLAYRNYDGVGTAAFVGVAVILLIAACGGGLPTSLKIPGVIELATQHAALQLRDVARAADPVAKAQRLEREYPALRDPANEVASAVVAAKRQAATTVAQVARAEDPTAQAQRIQEADPKLRDPANEIASAVVAAKRQAATTVAQVARAEDPTAQAQRFGENHSRRSFFLDRLIGTFRASK
jgi:hypothetical protein